MAEHTLKFPLDLAADNQAHWISFTANKVRQFQKDRKKANNNAKKKPYVSIYLPMPSTLQTSYGQNYATHELGIAGREVADYLSDGTLSNWTDTLTAVGFSALDSPAVKDVGFVGGAVAGAFGGGKVGDIIGGLTGAGAGSVVEGAVKGWQIGKGFGQNPHLAQLYQGPSDFREHSFSYKLIPKNEKESDILNEIIWALKYYSSPNTFYSGHFFSYPEQWEIDFRFNDYLFQIGQSVLTNVSINYHGEGVPAYFNKSGDEPAPVSIQIDMTFKETSIYTKDRVEIPKSLTAEQQNRLLVSKGGTFGDDVKRKLRDLVNYLRLETEATNPNQSGE